MISLSGKDPSAEESGKSGVCRRHGRPGGLLSVLLAALLLTGCAMGGATGTNTLLGIRALEEGSYQDAQEYFEAAIAQKEQPVLAYRGLGIAYMGLAEYAEAEAAFEQALSNTDDKMPETVEDIRLYLATAQYRQGSYSETIETCSLILDASKEGNADAYFLRGASSLYEGLSDEAGEDFGEAVALSKEDYDLYLNIYECYAAMNLSGLGGEYLQSALNISGEEQENYYNRGRIYYYLENYEEAQAQLIGPAEENYEPAMYLIGKVYLALGDCGHALDIYLQMQKEFGDTSEIYNGLTLCAIESGDYEAALSYISQGIVCDDTAAQKELYFNEIVVYERMLDFETAREKAREYVARYPSDAAGQKEWTFLSTR